MTVFRRKDGTGGAAKAVVIGEGEKNSLFGAALDPRWVVLDIQAEHGFGKASLVG